MAKKKDTTIPLTEARKRLFELTEEIQGPDCRYTFTRHGRRKAVLLSAEEYDSWLETLAVMREIPDLARDIKQAEQEYRRGELISLEDVLKKSHGIVSSQTNKGRRKTARKNR